VHGTPDTLQKFFADAVSRDYELVGVLSDENFLIQGLEVLAPKSVPPFVYKIIDAIIFTSTTDIRDFQFFNQTRSASPQNYSVGRAAGLAEFQHDRQSRRADYFFLRLGVSYPRR